MGAEVKLTDNMTMETAYGHSFANPNINSRINNTNAITHSVSLNGGYDIHVDIIASVSAMRFDRPLIRIDGC